MAEATKLPERLPLQRRHFEVRKEMLDTESRTLQLSFSSEEPVERRSFFGNYQEVLSHESKAVRMKRLRNGAPLLFNHDSDRIIGVVESASVKDGRGVATVRLAKNPAGEEALGLVSDDVLRNVSVGYLVHRYQITEGADKEPDEYRAIDWEPVEISLVAVPADPTVGVGRAAQEDFPVEFERKPGTREIAPADAGISQEGKRAMSTAAVVVNDDLLKNERARVNEIHAIRAQFPNEITADEAQKAIADGTEVRAVKDLVFDKIAKNAKVHEQRSAVLPEAEKKRYSFMSALRQAAGLEPRGLEWEVSEKIAKERGAAPRENAIYVPTNEPIARRSDMDLHTVRSLDGMLSRAGLDTLSNAAGAFTVFTEYISLIELLRNRMKVRSLGATVLSGLRDTIAFPRQSAAGTASWVAENPGSDVSDTALVLEQITLAPKILQSSTSYSRKLLAQSSVDVEALVRADLITIMAIAMDLAAISGLGSSNQPKGILNQSGIGSVSTGGAALGIAKIIDLETAVAVANADEGTMAYLTTPEVRGRLKKTPQLGNTLGMPIWGKGGNGPGEGEVNGYRAAVSNQVLKTPGHVLLFGDFSQLIIGEWGSMEIIVDPYRLKKQGMIEVTTYDMCDMNVRHVASFAAATDIDPNAE